jgi:hypothetical protein
MLVSLAPASWAADAAPRGRRWQPSIDLFMAGLLEDRSGETMSISEGFQDGETFGFPWSFGGEVALASPVLEALPGGPRTFVRMGGGFVMDSDDPVSTVGDAGSRPFVPPAQPDAESIENQGASLRAEANSWVLTGGVGTEWSFEWIDRNFHVRPSLEWMYRRDTIRAVLGEGRDDGLGLIGEDAPPCPSCALLFAKAQREKGYHSLGLGLDTSVEGGRLGAFLVHSFLSFRVYHILGDRKADLAATGTWELQDGSPSSADPQTSTLNVRYEREPFHYRVGAGLRLYWSPE